MFLKYQTETQTYKNAITVLRNSLEGFNISLDQVQERISKMHRQVIENNLVRGEKLKKT